MQLAETQLLDNQKCVSTRLLQTMLFLSKLVLQYLFWPRLLFYELLSLVSHFLVPPFSLLFCVEQYLHIKNHEKFAFLIFPTSKKLLSIAQYSSFYRNVKPTPMCGYLEVSTLKLNWFYSQVSRNKSAAQLPGF